MQHKTKFPFTAIIGQDDFKLCLLLNLIDPTIGGVLATGDKGTGKTTTVRALSQLMGKDFPFINLPIGATEDRVLGSVNIEALINQKKTIVDKGLLAKANQGFLYIDEINLLNDYLMDVLLDASSSGGYHLEREGISQWLESRFCLVGTMNPEEGDLRPQLKDRFGLSVNITTPKDIAIRKKIAIQRLDFDTTPTDFYEKRKEQELRLKTEILSAKHKLTEVTLSEEVQNEAAKLTIEANVEGMRADILLLKTARAYAALLNQDKVTVEILHRIATYVLQHRSKDFIPPESNNDKKEGENKEQEKPDKKDNQTQGNNSFQLPESVQNGLKFSIPQTSKKKEVILPTKTLKQTPYIATPSPSIALVKTIKNYMATEKFTAIYKQVTEKAAAKIVFLLDTSASMAVDKQLGYVKGIVQKTINRYPTKKVEYAIITLDNSSAKVVQDFTSDNAILNKINHQLRAGGKTNLGYAFFKVFELLKSINKKAVQLFVLTDGKINSGKENPFEYAIQSYKTYLSKLNNTTIIDTENGFVKLGRAKLLADTLKVNYIPLTSL
ncbi:magnesium chelatase subunit I [Tenacibaculum sp. 190524A02b]|uniref:Magnesium chelatase subunit I n=1 Tax=Tenacibaculum vairaonense TaxID=3137860 RepID=A0ABP1F870_9FLAO